MAAVVNRLGKQCTVPWPAAVAGAPGQGMAPSSARSKVQLQHGIISGEPLQAQLSPILCPTGATLSFTRNQCTLTPKQQKDTSYTGMPAHERTNMHG